MGGVDPTVMIYGRLKLLYNGINDYIRVLKNYIILEPECFDTMFEQKLLVTYSVFLRHDHVIVVISIKFNGQF